LIRQGSNAPGGDAAAARPALLDAVTQRARIKGATPFMRELMEGSPLKPQQSFALREAFSESDLPMRVDIVDAADLPAKWDIRVWPL
jgi:hypothetical protein